MEEVLFFFFSQVFYFFFVLLGFIWFYLVFFPFFGWFCAFGGDFLGHTFSLVKFFVFFSINLF